MSLSVWVLVLVNAGGEPFAVVQVQRRFAPEAVSHSLALAASLDAQRYSVNDIIHILMAEESGMSVRSRALVPLGTRATGRMAGGGGSGKTPPSGKHAGGISVCGGVFPLSERKPQDFAV